MKRVYEQLGSKERTDFGPHPDGIQDTGRWSVRLEAEANTGAPRQENPDNSEWIAKASEPIRPGTRFPGVIGFPWSPLERQWRAGVEFGCGLRNP